VTAILAPAGAPGIRARAGRLRRLVPGVAVAAVGTATAVGMHAVVPVLSALTVAVVLGMLVGVALPGAARDGLRWATRSCLRWGVVLLGLQLSLSAVGGLGAGTVAAVVATVLVAFVGTLALGRLIGVSPGLGLLIATGFSICGASAIAAMDSVAGARRTDVATGVTLVTLYGSAAIAFVPLLGAAMGLGDRQIGAWAGLSVHEVAQVVAAASPAGAAAVSLAVVVKLTRVLMLAPMVAAVGVAQRRRGTGTGERPPLVPLFVLGFLGMIVLRSSGVVPAGALSAASATTTVLFTAALFALGSAVRIGDLARTGRRGLVLGACSTVLVAGVGLATLLLAGTGA
jgi:uncharacterized integral membrane protein (TIGR00698 family)